ncbi:uncharacterized protein EDB91DRAFT_1041449, partial [Suillus paluster]|uniref:uncharacterized protein n=1 Tax=Suillus paluster TaxID=48578 RepID=UPI001B87803A
KVKVRRKLIVAILCTGNELSNLKSPNPVPSDGLEGVWDTNRPLLWAVLEGMEYGIDDLGNVADE